MKKPLLIFSGLIVAFSACTAVSQMAQYESAQYGFEFQYPKDWTLSEKSSDHNIVTVASKPNKPFGEEYLSINMKTVESTDACMNTPVGLDQPRYAFVQPFSTDHLETVNGLDYYYTEGGEGTAGTVYTGRIKRMYSPVDDQCFEVLENLTYSNVETVDQEKLDERWNELDSIFQTLIFEPRDAETEEPETAGLEDIGYGYNEGEVNENMKVGYGTNDRIPAPEDWRMLFDNYSGGFTVYAPAGWSLNPEQGNDSYVGTISGDGITLRYDYGMGVGPFSNHSDFNEANYEVQNVKINGFSTVIYTPKVVGQGSTVLNVLSPRGEGDFSLEGENLTSEQEQTVLQLFRTIFFGQ